MMREARAERNCSQDGRDPLFDNRIWGVALAGVTRALQLTC